MRIIEARAEAIGHKKSRYAAMIIKWWMDQGAPAVSHVDQTMRAEVMTRFVPVGTSDESCTENNNLEPDTKTSACFNNETLESEIELGVLKIVNGDVVFIKSSRASSGIQKQ
ncbi:hypothetical protein CKA38_04050 [Ereboglobus luteus]|uniref:Uncharacterized protein n=1 Tax=Ereboglobus luteus TaxID=1796921 RepID=A0A2U8E105_9BACT|nr:hypothetical protein CKA38_04050 [Ereboglobus luteus]